MGYDLISVIKKGVFSLRRDRWAELLSFIEPPEYLDRYDSDGNCIFSNDGYFMTAEQAKMLAQDFKRLIENNKKYSNGKSYDRWKDTINKFIVFAEESGGFYIF